MDGNKIKVALDYIRQHGGIPTDGTGRTLTEDEVLAWYKLDHLLTSEEHRQVKRELAILAEMEAFIDQVRLANA